MKTITITTHNRPQYLRKVIECLRIAISHTDTDYHLVAGVEPGCEDSLSQIESIDFIHTTIIKNEKKLGVRNNPHNLLKYVFETMNSDMNVYMEDDVIISPDALQMADWFFTQDTEYFSLQYFNRTRNNPNNLTDLIEINPIEFSALSFVLKRKNWDNLKSMWYLHKKGWDYSVCNNLDKKMITPSFSRSNHIGRVGTYMVSKIQDQFYTDRQMCEVTGPFEYKIQ